MENPQLQMIPTKPTAPNPKVERKRPGRKVYRTMDGLTPKEILFDIEEFINLNEDYDDHEGQLARDLDNYLYDNTGLSSVEKIIHDSTGTKPGVDPEDFRLEYEELVKQFPDINCPSFEEFIRS